MATTSPHPVRRLTAVLLALTAAAGCDTQPVGPAAEEGQAFAAMRGATEGQALAAMRSATARYHDLDAAIADGFILLHECEVRPGEGAVGLLYVHLGRFMDGTLDEASPDGLLYAPGPNGTPRLAGVELALPAAGWTQPEPPAFLGRTLQYEEEFDAWGLHVWVWQHNPAGMYAQAHPGIACEAE